MNTDDLVFETMRQSPPRDHGLRRAPDAAQTAAWHVWCVLAADALSCPGRANAHSLLARAYLLPPNGVRTMLDLHRRGVLIATNLTENLLVARNHGEISSEPPCTPAPLADRHQS